MDIFTDKSLSPNLQKYLQVIPQELLHHSSYSMKHPSAIYNVSLMKIDGALRDFMEVFSMYDSPDFEEVDKNNTTKLLQNYKTLLYAFREYLDDCYSILKTFIEPPRNEKKNRVQYKWLEINAKPEIDDFLQVNLEYKKYLDHITMYYEELQELLDTQKIQSSFSIVMRYEELQELIDSEKIQSSHDIVMHYEELQELINNKTLSDDIINIIAFKRLLNK